MSLWEWILWLLGLLKKVKPPQRVLLQQLRVGQSIRPHLSKRIGVFMPDVKLSWQPSPSPGVTGYAIAWTLNGAPSGGFVQPAQGDIQGSRNFGLDNFGVSLLNGDVVGASIHAVNSTNNTVSIDVVPPPVTISIVPPPPPTLEPPTLVTLVQV